MTFCYRILPARKVVGLAMILAVSATAGPPTDLFPGVRERVSLDGPWHVRYDEADVLKHEIIAGETFAAVLSPCGPAGDAQVTIPASIEEDRPGYDGIVWYWRDFVVPSHWAGSRIALEFGAIDHRSEITVNGRRKGETSSQGGYSPFSEDITDRVRFGTTNRVVVRVQDLTLEIPESLSQQRISDVIYMIPSGQQTTHGNFGGIWQSVSLLRLPQLYLADVYIAARYSPSEAVVYYTYHVPSGWDKPVSAQFALVATTDAADVQATDQIDLPTDRPGIYPSRLTLFPRRVRPWSPEDPVLYDVVVTLRSEGRVFDQVRVRTGFRDIDFSNGHYTLNGRPFLLRAASYMSGDGRSVAPPTRVELFRREIAMAKATGLNAFLLRTTALPPPLLDAADEAGWFLIAEPPTGDIQPSRLAKNLALGEMNKLALRDRSHPSIFGWARIAGDRALDTDAERHFFAVKIRQLDHNHVLFDRRLDAPATGGCYLPGATDAMPYHVISTDEGGNAALDPRVATWIHVQGVSGLAQLVPTLDQFGTSRSGLPFEPESALRRIIGQLLEQYELAGLSRDFPTLSDWLKLSGETQASVLRARVEKALAVKGAAGVMVDCWNDASWDVRGFVSQFRQGKPALDAMSAALAPVTVRVATVPSAIRSGQGFPFSVTVESREEKPLDAQLHIKVWEADSSPDRPFYVAAQHIAFTDGAAIQFQDRLPDRSGNTPLVVSAWLQLGSERIAETTAYTLRLAPAQLPAVQAALVTTDTRLVELVSRLGMTPQHGLPDTAQRSLIIAGPFRQEATSPVFSLLPQLYDRVYRGDCAIVFGVPLLTRPSRDGWMLAVPEAFPFPVEAIELKRAGISPTHFARPHAATAALPAPCGLGLIAAANALLPDTVLATRAEPDAPATWLPGTTIAGWFAPARGRALAWDHVGQGWAGSDLVEIPYGQGRFLVCALPLVEQSSTHLLAERLFADLVLYGLSHTTGPLSELTKERRARHEAEAAALAQIP